MTVETGQEGLLVPRAFPSIIDTYTSNLDLGFPNQWTRLTQTPELIKQEARRPQCFMLAQCECSSVSSYSLHLESKFCSFQSSVPRQEP